MRPTSVKNKQKLTPIDQQWIDHKEGKAKMQIHQTRLEWVENRILKQTDQRKEREEINSQIVNTEPREAAVPAGVAAHADRRSLHMPAEKGK